jgi:predicted HNH restriction endonuclease
MHRSHDPTALRRNCPNRTYIEGAKQRITVNTYERNPAARRRCLEHYGTKRAVGTFDFEARYGDLGKGFIHVHHLRPLAAQGKEYELDPIDDLRPVCLNCHAMIHARPIAVSIEELRALVRP